MERQTCATTREPSALRSVMLTSTYSHFWAQCLSQSGGDISRCQFYFDALEQCKKSGI